MKYIFACIIWVVVTTITSLSYIPAYIRYQEMTETTMATVVAARDALPPDTARLGGGEWITRYIEMELSFSTSSGESVQLKHIQSIGGRPEDVSDSVALQIGHNISITYNPSNPHELLLTSERRSLINSILAVSMALFLYLAILVAIGSKRFKRNRAVPRPQPTLFI